MLKRPSPNASSPSGSPCTRPTPVSPGPPGLAYIVPIRCSGLLAIWRIEREADRAPVRAIPVKRHPDPRALQIRPWADRTCPRPLGRRRRSPAECDPGRRRHPRRRPSPRRGRPRRIRLRLRHHPAGSARPFPRPMSSCRSLPATRSPMARSTLTGPRAAGQGGLEGGTRRTSTLREAKEPAARPDRFSFSEAGVDLSARRSLVQIQCPDLQKPAWGSGLPVRGESEWRAGAPMPSPTPLSPAASRATSHHRRPRSPPPGYCPRQALHMRSHRTWKRRGSTS